MMKCAVYIGESWVGLNYGHTGRALCVVGVFPETQWAFWPDGLRDRPIWLTAKQLYFSPFTL